MEKIIKFSTDLFKYLNITDYFSKNYDYYVYPITKRLNLSNLPREIHLNKIKPSQYDVIISVMQKTEQGTSEIEWIDQTKIKHHFVEITDYTSPTKKDYQKFMKIINKYPREKILVHCYAGKGRSNCMVCYYLMKSENLSPTDAIYKVEQLNPRSKMNYNQKQSLF